MNRAGGDASPAGSLSFRRGPHAAHLRRRARHHALQFRGPMRDGERHGDPAGAPAHPRQDLAPDEQYPTLGRPLAWRSRRSLSILWSVHLGPSSARIHLATPRLPAATRRLRRARASPAAVAKTRPQRRRAMKRIITIVALAALVACDSATGSDRGARDSGTEVRAPAGPSLSGGASHRAVIASVRKRVAGTPALYEARGLAVDGGEVTLEVRSSTTGFNALTSGTLV